MEVDLEEEAPPPRWYYWLRALIFILIIASIAAMASLAFAAWTIINNFEAKSADPLDNLFRSDQIPDGGVFLSASRHQGGVMILYKMGESVHGRYYDGEGVLRHEKVFE